MDIVSLGELLVDMFPAELGRRLADVTAFYPKPGGAPANVAVAAARLGARSAFIGRVGEDAFGYHLLSVLRAEGVETRGIQFDPLARTTMAFIALLDANTAEFVFYRNPGADMRLDAEELDRSLLQSTRAFHFGSISLIDEPSRSTTMEALRISRESGCLVSFDVNYRPTLWASATIARERILELASSAHVVKVNDTELTLLTGTNDLDAGSRALLEQGVDLCVVTLGQEGSFFRVADGGGYVPAFQVDVIDATGCGDAFVAGLLCRLVLGRDWRSALEPGEMRRTLRYANAVGALTAQKIGVIPALPTSAEVYAFLESVYDDGSDA